MRLTLSRGSKRAENQESLINPCLVRKQEKDREHIILPGEDLSQEAEKIPASSLPGCLKSEKVNWCAIVFRTVCEGGHLQSQGFNGNGVGRKLHRRAMQTEGRW